MKLTTFLLIIALAHASANSFSQVRLSEKDVSLEKVLMAIKKQTNTNFFYNRKDIAALKVSIKVNNVSLKEALDKCLSGLPLSYDIQDNTIFLSKKTSSILDRIIDVINSIDIKGRVIDERGLPLEGATVRISNKSGKPQVTKTDRNGLFTFKNVEENDIVTITMLGYLPKELPGKLDINIIQLTMSSSKLDEVRVVAYGEDTKRFSVGSVSTLTAKDIEKQPVTNVLLALEGQVPGLVITPSSGAPGAAVRMQIRGQNTMNQNVSERLYDQPLIIVDGVPMATQNVNINQLASFGASNSGNTTRYAGGLSPFGTINPADIESISTLRDADATSIYGSQGANGVILITTKRGKAGKVSLDLSLNTGVNIATQQVEMLNTTQYLQLRREAFANDKVTPQGTNANAAGYAPDLTFFDQNKNTNWFDYFMGKTSLTKNLNASVSGGNNLATFMISGGFTREGYNFPGDYANDRMTLHSSFQYSSTDKKLTINLGTDLGYNNNNSSLVSGIGRNIITPPNYPDLLSPEGNLIWDYKGFNLSRFQIYSALKQTNELKAFNLNNSLQVAYRIIPSLKFITNVGYSRFTTDEHQKTPLASLAPGSTVSSAAFGSSTNQTINIEPQLNYSQSFGKGELNVMLGGTYKQNTGNSTAMRGSGYSNDALLGIITAATTINITSDISTMYKYVAGFGRIGYTYDQKYIISLTGRRDGSSNFGPGNQFGNFGAAGLGWIVSEEKFIKSNLSFLSFAKLSANYGTSGSDQAAAYKFQPFWQVVANTNPFQGTQPLSPSNLENRNFSWNLKKSLNAAMDLGFFNDRILLNATWYKSRSSKQLLNMILPSQTGAVSVLDNSPATVQNSGLEFTLTSTNIKAKDFQWSTNFNISRNRNILYSFPNLASSSYASAYIIGMPINMTYGFNYKGVNPQTGTFEFYDAKGNTVAMPRSGLANDFIPIYDQQPKFFGGLTNTFTYKNLSLSFFFQFSKQTGVNFLGSLIGDLNAVIPGGFGNLPVQALNRWQKPGDITDFPKLTANPQANFDLSNFNFLTSSGAYGDASYIRLKNVSLSYSLPASLLKKIKMKNIRLYINAQNLFLITGYEVGDPESAGGLFSFPLQRTVAGGLSINL